MADITQSPGPGWTQNAGGDWSPPSDKNIPYTVDAGGKPTITSPGGTGMPGHTQTVDPRAVQAQAAAAFTASGAKTQNGFKPTFTPAPRRGK
jgi:hypothetical protein